ncbi:MAG: hypothetical protein OYI31_06020 [Chloroflexota bacterium]|nr:hypothetical protein [Chloroflexota bacterium]MDE2942538.1 hypothetical protein [Chloroflexota bacterium]MDE3267990.1 hypothetical protein [Chloroflexota bacterium]
MTGVRSISNAPGISPVRAGLTAGSAAAVCGSLLNLPLHSPSDALLNSGTVTAASLAGGLGAGLLWQALGRTARRPAIFSAAIAVVFMLVTAAAAAGESQLERSVSYLVPLAALTLGITAVLTLLLMTSGRALPLAVTIVSVIAALGIGAALAGMGDQESGRLELPPRSAPWSAAGSDLA